jgi:hypothetical protein
MPPSVSPPRRRRATRIRAESHEYATPIVRENPRPVGPDQFDLSVW